MTVEQVEHRRKYKREFARKSRSNKAVVVSTKHCPICGSTHPEGYTKRSDAFCAPCRDVRHKHRAKKHRARNKDKDVEASRAYGRMKQAEYRARNQDHLVRIGQWKADNPEKVKATRAAFYHRHKEKLKEKSRNLHFKAKYGLTLDERAAMLARQDNRCAVCGTNDPGGRTGWHIDHCHASGSVREILCQGCNLALGGAKDSAETLRKLAAYLEKHRQRQPAHLSTLEVSHGPQTLATIQRG